MQTEARIFLKNRHIAKATKKRKKNYFESKGKKYLINPDCFVILKDRPWFYFGFQRNRLINYFIEGNPAAIPLPELEHVDKLGISDEELDVIFAPEFYRIIARAGKNPKQDMMLYLMFGIAGMNAYIVWKSTDIVKMLQLILEAAGVN